MPEHDTPHLPSALVPLTLSSKACLWLEPEKTRSSSSEIRGCTFKDELRWKAQFLANPACKETLSSVLATSHIPLRLQLQTGTPPWSCGSRRETHHHHA